MTAIFEATADELVGAVPQSGAVRTLGDVGSDSPSVRRSPSHGRLLVGDNLALLSAQGFEPASVRLAYLDPPFNTGERFHHYDDRRSSDEWAQVLRDRLRAIKPLLRLDGSIWLHLDDREQHYGRVILDEVFGRDAFVSTVIWQKRTSRDNRRAFSSSHDYIHVYSPIGENWKRARNGLPNEGGLSNPDDDPRGGWRSVPVSVQAGHGVPSQFYELRSPTGRLVAPPRGRCWAYSRQKMAQLEKEGRIYWTRGGDGTPRLKRFVDELKPLAPSTIWLSGEVGDNATAKRELMKDVAAGEIFATPKPLNLMRRIIEIATNPDELVLDPYLGSGSTAIAADELGRRWCGIEASAVTVTEVTVPRLMANGVSFASI
ncbi:site-specific DNA-methyltransferase [Curtobacterium sp. Csp2]|uniref:site-specific DNA-methyltransferase n=1 Tax=Curtobacterium sp. Csp2 TaxID=2495430 RepID=UPI0015810D54|nr:site-specific DNA-methyltransferase [Curtobacterium sp. Csp2]QKS15414.1 site-specific DNA-methyltransferase [Curtobacterium sp. Csp2]